MRCCPEPSRCRRPLRSELKPGSRKLTEMLRSARPVLLALIPAVALAIEEPRYEVVRQIDDAVELRRYAPYVVAEVVLDTRAADAGNRGSPSWPPISSARTRATGNWR